MDIARIERRLKKISALIDAFKDDNTISSIEKDLLLQYIRELYELALGDVDVPSSTPTVVKEAPQPAPEPKPAPKVEVTPPPVVEVAAPKVEPTPVKEPEPTPPVAIVPPAPVATPAPQPAPEPAPAPPPTPAPVSYPVAAKYKELFVEEKISDMSDKLSMAHINDIGKAMGINERILVITELFGNNSQAFIDAVAKLNAFSHMDEAKQYLTQEVIDTYHWLEEDNVAHAKNFIKLIRRRYN